MDAPSAIEFGRRAKTLAAGLLRERGHLVAMTPHKERFDLWVSGAKIEIKASAWDGRRYQFNLRGSRADVYLLACCAGDEVLTWFVVPSEAIEGRRHVAVSNADPTSYAGQWARYREAWEHVDAAVIGAGPAPWQLSLWEAQR